MQFSSQNMSHLTVFFFFWLCEHNLGIFKSDPRTDIHAPKLDPYPIHLSFKWHHNSVTERRVKTPFKDLVSWKDRIVWDTFTNWGLFSGGSAGQKLGKWPPTAPATGEIWPPVSLYLSIFTTVNAAFEVLVCTYSIGHSKVVERSQWSFQAVTLCKIGM